ncbi:hypothetical protein PHMEG_00015208 [Phytophthora megakarya]|uniref:Uncharacterized protein n=1 Tax=Phytophthora megakarya TaxID=4795 RepID=A0A225W4F8_9STRA|nr:hypothetical protein PHMEG_00015208 [Phytophthora megakarya]
MKHYNLHTKSHVHTARDLVPKIRVKSVTNNSIGVITATRNDGGFFLMTCFAHYPGKVLARYVFASWPNKAAHRNFKTSALLTALLIFNRPSSRYGCEIMSVVVTMNNLKRSRDTRLSHLPPLQHVSGVSLLELVQLWRNLSAHDERPNRALNAGWTSVLLRDFQFHDLVVNIISSGVQHVFTIHIGSSNVPKNHNSARPVLNALRCSVRQGQYDGTYLVVDLDVARQWNILRFSPFGCVPKKAVDPRVEARRIHNLSFPTTSATNAMPNKD